MDIKEKSQQVGGRFIKHTKPVLSLLHARQQPPSILKSTVSTQAPALDPDCSERLKLLIHLKAVEFTLMQQF